MTDPTRHIRWHDDAQAAADAEAAATASSQHTYPRGEQPGWADTFAGQVAADARRFRRRALVALAAALFVVGVVLGVVL